MENATHIGNTFTPAEDYKKIHPHTKFSAMVLNHNTSVFGYFKSACSAIWRFIRSFIRLNWITLVAAILIVMVDSTGILDSFPALHWFAQVELRFWNWLFGICHSFLVWTFDGPFKNIGNVPVIGNIFNWLQSILFG